MKSSIQYSAMSSHQLNNSIVFLVLRGSCRCRITLFGFRLGRAPIVEAGPRTPAFGQQAKSRVTVQHEQSVYFYDEAYFQDAYDIQYRTFPYQADGVR